MFSSVTFRKAFAKFVCFRNISEICNVQQKAIRKNKNDGVSQKTLKFTFANFDDNFRHIRNKNFANGFAYENFHDHTSLRVVTYLYIA